MPTPASRSNVRRCGDAKCSKYGPLLRAPVAGEMGPRFRGDDKFEDRIFPRTALRKRGKAGSAPLAEFTESETIRDVP
jgi:hypothetical protein